MGRLDPRDPLVLGAHDLDRRPGSLLRWRSTLRAPEGLANGVLHVRAGEDLALELRLESVVEGVLVTGTAVTRADGECVRCLDPLQETVEADLQELYVYPDVEVEGEDPDEVLRLQGDLVDLRQVLRDAVVLAMPLLPLCREDCPGLCPACGARLAEDPEHDHAATDPRWAALQKMFDSAPSGADPQET